MLTKIKESGGRGGRWIAHQDVESDWTHLFDTCRHPIVKVDKSEQTQSSWGGMFVKQESFPT